MNTTNRSIKSLNAIAIIAAMAVIGAGQSALAVSATWVGGTDFLWSTGANWSSTPANTPPGALGTTNNTDTATITISNAGTIVPDTTRNIQNVIITSTGAGTASFGTTSYALNLTVGGALTASGAQNINLNQTFTIQAPTGGTYNFTTGTGSTAKKTSLNGAISAVGAGLTTVVLDGGHAGTASNYSNVTAVISNGSGGGTVAVTKGGAGQWGLNRANTYTGATTISGGTLFVSSTGTINNSSALTMASGTGFDISLVTSAFTVAPTGGNTSQIFNGLGSLTTGAKTFQVSNNGIFNGGGGSGSTGSLSVIGGLAGAFTLGSGTTTNFEINGSTLGQFDQLTFSGTGTTLALTLGGTLNLSTGYTPTLGDSINLFDWTTLTGTFSSISGLTNVNGSGLNWDTTNLYNTGQILAVAGVPEPSTWALFGCSMVGLLIFSRRKFASA